MAALGRLRGLHANFTHHRAGGAPAQRLQHWSTSAAAPKPTVIFVLGGPGAGKGTQCSKLTEHGFVHLSAGELLRLEREKGGETGLLIDRHLAAGSIVPNEITCDRLPPPHVPSHPLACTLRARAHTPQTWALQRHVLARGRCGLLLGAMERSASRLFLIDGYPRNWDNCQVDRALRLVLHWHCSYWYCSLLAACALHDSQHVGLCGGEAGKSESQTAPAGLGTDRRRQGGPRAGALL